MPIRTSARRFARLDQSPDSPLREVSRDALAELRRFQRDSPSSTEREKLIVRLYDAIRGTEAQRFRYTVQVSGSTEVFSPARIVSHPGAMVEIASGLDIDDPHRLRRHFSECREPACMTLKLNNHEGQPLIGWDVTFGGIEDMPLDCDATDGGYALERFMLLRCVYVPMTKVGLTA